MMSDNDALVLTTMQILGRCRDTLVDQLGNWKFVWGVCGSEPLFDFARYDLVLEHEWLKHELGVEFSDRQLAQLRDITSLETMECIYAMATKAAARQIAIAAP